MSSKKRPYSIKNEDTGAVHMVLAISKAQAVSFIARNLFTTTAASGIDVANHAMNGGKIEDATAGQAVEYEDDGDVDGTGGQDSGDVEEWMQHRSGGIAGRAGIESD